MKLFIDPFNKKEALGDLFGIFFEDINHGADGGLYGELVQNRSFEFDPIDNESYHHLTAWEKIENGGQVRLLIETGGAVSPRNPHYLGIDVIQPARGEDEEAGVCNTGFNSGIPLREGATYDFTCYAKREQSLEEPVKVSLRGRDGQVYASKEIFLTTDWQKYELELTAGTTDYEGRLGITCGGRGKVYLDFVSLFPADTYKGRPNGLRRDLAEALEVMHPKFMRFPGGCLVHDGSLDAQARDSQYRWKNTIGPLEERPARRSNWGYNQTLGLGYFEYFQFCEDIKAKPLPVLPAGYNPHYHRAAPLDQLGPWIEDALDLIEFANGAEDTPWGKIRAELGHPAPFGLEYLGIGNEEVGEEFFERFDVIYEAVHKKYPGIKVVGTSGPFAAGGEFDRGWANARRNGIALVDEHYYQAPEWFLANHHRYDSYPKDGTKVFLGEYASWGNTWFNALAEASYMIGLERSAGKVGLVCYAPLLCNAGYVNWQPDLIWFDNHQIMRTANYYVQKLFMEHQGSRLVQIRAEDVPENEMWTGNPENLPGKLILSTDDSASAYTEISVTCEDTGEVKRYQDCILDRGQELVLQDLDCVNYTVRLKARELRGFKGFRIGFGCRDRENQFYWLLGGWQNQDNILGEKIHGRGSDLSQYQFSVEKGREYALELQVRGRHISTFVDGKKYHDVEAKPVAAEPLYYSASVEEETGDLLMKAVNMTDTDREVLIQVEGLAGGSCRVYYMGGWEMECKNELGKPEQIYPRETSFSIEGDTFRYCYPGKSLTVFRIHGEERDFVLNEDSHD